jgi:hypothetical protein
MPRRKRLQGASTRRTGETDFSGASRRHVLKPALLSAVCAGIPAANVTAAQGSRPGGTSTAAAALGTTSRWEPRQRALDSISWLPAIISNPEPVLVEAFWVVGDQSEAQAAAKLWNFHSQSVHGIPEHSGPGTDRTPRSNGVAIAEGHRVLRQGSVPEGQESDGSRVTAPACAVAHQLHLSFVPAATRSPRSLSTLRQ